MAYMVMAYVDTVFQDMACIVMAYIVLANIVMAYVVAVLQDMTYTVMAYIVMANIWPRLLPSCKTWPT